jgi:hypothetical protein
MKLRIRALALAGGIVWGLYVFLTTLWLLWFHDGASVTLLVNLYPGYATTYLGSFIGLLWGFVDGAFCGALTAWLYNRFQRVFYNSEATQ